MKLIIRSLVTLIAALATFYFTFWMPFVLILPADGPEWIALAGAAICGVAAGRYVWTHSTSFSTGFASCVGMGALTTGAVGFSAGFFGPLVFAPGANQGPLLGIFITGPLGFLFGAVGGAAYWFVRGRKGAVAGGAS